MDIQVKKQKKQYQSPLMESLVKGMMGNTIAHISGI